MAAISPIWKYFGSIAGSLIACLMNMTKIGFPSGGNDGVVILGDANATKIGDFVNGYELVRKFNQLGMPVAYEQSCMMSSSYFSAQVIETCDNASPVVLQWSCNFVGSYCLEDHIFKGGHGNVWKARATDGTRFVLKKMHTFLRKDIQLCAFREVYFGEYLRGKGLPIARFISHFELDGNFWLVFVDEGISLQQLLYKMTITEVSAMMEPSIVWKRLRTTASGEHSVKAVMQQLIAATAALHREGVLHRDIKPSNIVLNAGGDLSTGVKLLLVDFSSAVEKQFVGDLYGPAGPSTLEETLQYAPPEVLLTADTDLEIPYDAVHRESYDIWSIGVVFLEMILGTADVFSVDQRTKLLIEHQLKQRRRRFASNSGSEAFYDLRNSVLLAGLADYCLYTEDLFPQFQAPSSTQSSASGTDVVNSDWHQSFQFTPAEPDGHTVSANAMIIIAPGNNSEFLCPRITESQSHIEENSFQLSTVICRSEKAVDQPNAFRRKLHKALGPLSGESCGKEFSTTRLQRMNQAIMRRDPLGKGLHDRWALDLLSRLLHFQPSKRISLVDALRHAYFVGPYRSLKDASEHATYQEARAHDKTVKSEFKFPDSYFEFDDVHNDLISDEPVDFEYQSLVPIDDPHERLIPMHFSIVDVSTTVDEGEASKLLACAAEELVLFHDTSNLDDGVDQDHSDLDGSGDEESHHSAELADPADDIVNKLNFICPKCHRVFRGNWHACHQHVLTRRHGHRCDYLSTSHTTTHTTDEKEGEDVWGVEENITVPLDELLPQCLSTHGMLPTDAASGWCDLQGRRKYIEDVHAMDINDNYRYVGVFDGHFGAFAAKYSAVTLQRHIDEEFLLNLDNDKIYDEEEEESNSTDNKSPAAGALNFVEYEHRLDQLNPGVNWSAIVRVPDMTETITIRRMRYSCDEPQPSGGDVEDEDDNEHNAGGPINDTVTLTMHRLARAVRAAFLVTDSEVATAAFSAVGDRSGTTATALLVLEQQQQQGRGTLLVLGHVGDSRVLLCCEPESGAAVVLTVDHTAAQADERKRVVSNGGWVSAGGKDTIPRVNGTLAVSRSIGDAVFGDIVTAEPDVLILQLRSQVHQSSSQQQHRSMGSLCAQYMALAHQWDTDHRRPHHDHDSTSHMFLVVASDGLWDVLSSGEVSETVCGHLTAQAQRRARGLCLEDSAPDDDDEYDSRHHHTDDGADKDIDNVHVEEDDDFGSAGGAPGATFLCHDSMHLAAKMLAQEAFVRGSSDNIGVSIVLVTDNG